MDPRVQVDGQDNRFSPSEKDDSDCADAKPLKSTATATDKEQNIQTQGLDDFRLSRFWWETRPNSDVGPFIDLDRPYSLLDLDDEGIEFDDKRNGPNQTYLSGQKTLDTLSGWQSNIGPVLFSAKRGIRHMKSAFRVGSSSSHVSFLPMSSRGGPFNSCAKVVKWTWFWPLATGCSALLFCFLGLYCLVNDVQFFKFCAITFFSIGILTPLVYICVALWTFSPSRYQLEHKDFYSEALLEELIAGENILNAYSSTTGINEYTKHTENVVVFLSPIGGVPETWQHQVKAIVESGFSALTIQLPGSGVFNAVEFSFSRAEKVVIKALKSEGLLQQDDVLDSAMTAQSPFFRDASENNTISTENSDKPPTKTRKIILVAWGRACHVAMYLAAPHRFELPLISGLVLLGSPPLPNQKVSLCESFFCVASRIPWFGNLKRAIELKILPKDVSKCVDRTAFCIEAFAGWKRSFDSMKESLSLSFRGFDGPVCCLSDSEKYLDKVRVLRSNDSSKTWDTNTETFYQPQLSHAGFSLFPNPIYNAVYSQHIAHLVQSIAFRSFQARA